MKKRWYFKIEAMNHLRLNVSNMRVKGDRLGLNNMASPSQKVEISSAESESRVGLGTLLGSNFPIMYRFSFLSTDCPAVNFCF
jgi:hypothetical protein